MGRPAFFIDAGVSDLLRGGHEPHIDLGEIHPFLEGLRLFRVVQVKFHP